MSPVIVTKKVNKTVAIGVVGPPGGPGSTGPAGPAGPEGMVWRGIWSAATAYVVDDVVSFEGSSYIAIQAHSGQTPTWFSAYWQLVAAKGDPGAGGGGSYYRHVQSTPAAVWVITHGLGYRPNVTVVDSTARQVEGDVEHVNDNELIVSFSAAFAGEAYLS